MNKHTKIILVVLILLMVASVITVSINYFQSRERLALLNNQEITISQQGNVLSSITMDDLRDLGEEEFKANLKSSVMTAPKEHTYTGVSLGRLLSSIGISLDSKNSVTVESVDGYSVPLKIEEIKALDNIFIVFKDDGRYLGGYEDPDGQGPYMIVIREDKFSQRWAKYVVGLDVQ